MATMISRPSGVHARVNGRAWPLGSSVPTCTRATSAFGEPILARSTSAIEIVFPSTSYLQGAIGVGALTALIEAGTRLGSALEKRCASPQGMEGLSIYYPRTS